MMENQFFLKTTQINLFDCSHVLMTNKEEMELFLSKLVNFIDMTLISEDLVGARNPNAFLYNPPDKDEIDYGVTGIAILAESHASAHTWPNRNLLNVVITSCKEYDSKFAALWVTSYCKSKIYKWETICF